MNLRFIVSAIFSLVFCKSQSVSANGIPDIIKNNIKGDIISNYSFKDNSGDHMCVLVKQFIVDANENERIILNAIQFISLGTAWHQEWIIKDWIDCQHLDIEGNFFSELTAITDLDENGVKETTVSYSTLCAGDISPKVVKTIMRQGSEKYAVRGESLVRLDDKHIAGGKYTVDKSLDSLPKFKFHLVNTWKKAAKVND